MHDETSPEGVPAAAGFRYWLLDVPASDPQRPHQLARYGVPLHVVQNLQQPEANPALGQALADAEVAHSFLNLATSGKCPTATLTWAKQRLGFGDGEIPDAAHTPTRDAENAAAMAALHTMLEQLAALKAGSVAHAHPVAEHGAPQPAAPSREQLA